MKALTINQPWAALIVCGDKKVENRSWNTDFRGRFAVHAGTDKRTCRQLKLEDEYMEMLPFGEVIGTVGILDCLWIGDPLCADYRANMRRATKLYPWFKKHEYINGPWCWILEEPNQFEEGIPAKGQLRFWEWSPPKGVRL